MAIKAVNIEYEDGVVYAGFVKGQLVGVYQGMDEAIPNMAWRTGETEGIVEQFHIYSDGQRGHKYKVNLETGDCELIKHEMHFTSKMEYDRITEFYPDGKSYEISDRNSFAVQCSMDCFDIPAMVKDIQEHGYEVTEDMLKRWLELWLTRDGRTVMYENGIKMYSPCSCCNPFSLTISHNGDPTRKELYAI